MSTEVFFQGIFCRLTSIKAWISMYSSIPDQLFLTVYRGNAIVFTVYQYKYLPTLCVIVEPVVPDIPLRVAGGGGAACRPGGRPHSRRDRPDHLLPVKQLDHGTIGHAERCTHISEQCVHNKSVHLKVHMLGTYRRVRILFLMRIAFSSELLDVYKPSFQMCTHRASDVYAQSFQVCTHRASRCVRSQLLDVYAQSFKIQ